jgi:hypothetical protein
MYLRPRRHQFLPNSPPCNIRSISDRLRARYSATWSMEKFPKGSGFGCGVGVDWALRISLDYRCNMELVSRKRGEPAGSAVAVWLIACRVPFGLSANKVGVLRGARQKKGSVVGLKPPMAWKGSGWKSSGVRGCGQLGVETVGVCRAVFDEGLGRFLPIGENKRKCYSPGKWRRVGFLM